MCTTCGCGEGEIQIEGGFSAGNHLHKHEHPHAHEHEHPHDHAHPHEHEHRSSAAKETIVVHHHYHHNGDVHHHYHNASDVVAPVASAPQSPTPPFQPHVNAQGDLDYGQGQAQTHAPGMSQKRMLEIELNVLDKNNKIAVHNREHFAHQHILALNLVSSPGSGKTTLLTETLNRISKNKACAVIEGDQQTSNDADRIRATGVPAIQVNTGKGCHLDAQMVHDAAHNLGLKDNSILFIENVGNLVCPAGFDLGEQAKVVVLSVTEGEDKPLKYPHMFAAASLMLINKIDLLPHVNFDVKACIANARKINPSIEAIQISATSGEGMSDWLNWLAHQASHIQSKE